MKFDNAYAPYTNGTIDSLIIETSTNTGSTYTPLVKLYGSNAGGPLNTVPALGSAFTPTSGQWATKKYALPVGTNKIKFRARSGFGNNLYLDSICVVNSAAPVPAVITVAPQGFYNTVTGKLNMRDTTRVYLRSIVAPYVIVDSAKAVIDSLTLSGSFIFSSAPTGTYYVVVKRRSDLETWSKAGGESYTSGAAFNYNFTTAQSQAYGSNLILVGTKFCNYTGDVDKNHIISLTDITATSNDATLFATGYVNTDLTGDRIVNLNDVIVVYNNSANFVTRQAPPGATPEVIAPDREQIKKNVIKDDETVRKDVKAIEKANEKKTENDNKVNRR